MATERFDERAAEQFEQNYRQQFQLLTDEVEALEERIESLPQELRDSKGIETKLKTELLQTQQKIADLGQEERKVRNDLAGKRKTLDEMTERHHNYERVLKSVANENRNHRSKAA